MNFSCQNSDISGGGNFIIDFWLLFDGFQSRLIEDGTFVDGEDIFCGFDYSGAQNYYFCVFGAPVSFTDNSNGNESYNFGKNIAKKLRIDLFFILFLPILSLSLSLNLSFNLLFFNYSLSHMVCIIVVCVFYYV